MRRLLLLDRKASAKAQPCLPGIIFTHSTHMEILILYGAVRLFETNEVVYYGKWDGESSIETRWGKYSDRVFFSIIGKWYHGTKPLLLAKSECFSKYYTPGQKTYMILIIISPTFS